MSSETQYRQESLFLEYPQTKANAYEKRNAPTFLRNQFIGIGKYEFPLIRKQVINLDNVGLIACTNTRLDDQEYYDFGVHFFVDDYDFGHPYEAPEKTYNLYSQYRFCLTPDYSVYAEMPTWRQIESVARSRWCGAWWQSRGMTVIPTVSWDKYPSYDFCFDGIEPGSILAIATYACRQDRSAFLRGYDAMLERIRPQAIICYGNPLPGMRGNITTIQVCHPRQFHRELRPSPHDTVHPSTTARFVACGASKII